MINFQVSDYKAFFNALKSGGNCIDLVRNHRFKETGLELKIYAVSNGTHYGLHGQLIFDYISKQNGSFTAKKKPAFGFEKQEVVLDDLVEAYSRSENRTCSNRKINSLCQLFSES